MRTVVEITLPPLPYDQNISEITGYLSMILSEMTNGEVRLHINDYDFTDKISVFKNTRRASIFNRD